MTVETCPGTRKITASPMPIARAAACRNLTNPQTVTMPLPQPGLEASWDCEALGLNVSAGDNVLLFVRGVVFTPVFAGSVDRLIDGANVNCRNVTQGAAVQTPLDPDGTWDCAAAGLPLADQDIVHTVVIGVAR